MNPILPLKINILVHGGVDYALVASSESSELHKSVSNSVKIIKVGL